jgi:hypothetical protein
MTDKQAKPPRRRRVVVVEYDVTGLAPEQVDALLFGVLASGQNVSFKIEITPGVDR